MVVAKVTNHFDPESPVLQRVETDVFPRIEMPWFRRIGRLFGSARAGDLLLFVDLVEDIISVARVHAARRDGKAWVLAWFAPEPGTKPPGRHSGVLGSPSLRRHARR
jgi:hypothetical protein